MGFVPCSFSCTVPPALRQLREILIEDAKQWATTCHVAARTTLLTSPLWHSIICAQGYCLNSTRPQCLLCCRYYAFREEELLNLNDNDMRGCVKTGTGSAAKH